MKRSIVTGATGFIGTALCEELLKNGHEVFAVIRPGSAKREKLESLGKELLLKTADGGLQLHILENPLENLQGLVEQGIKADCFYHLAWEGSSGDERNRFEKQYVNIQYTANAIRTARACGCSKFVGAGSQAEYGVVRGIAKEYETALDPFMMYGAAKLAAYQMGKLVAQQEGISFVWPRIYSVYGVGENPGTLVNYVIDTLRTGEIPQVSECENMWDFTYIDDAVRMLRMLGEAEDTEGLYNVSAGQPRLLREFVEEIRDIVSPDSEIAFGAKSSDPKKTFWLEPDVGRIRDVAGECEAMFEKGIKRKLNCEKERME